MITVNARLFKAASLFVSGEDTRYVVMEIYSDELDGIKHTNGVAAAVLVAVLTCGGFRAVAATADASK